MLDTKTNYLANIGIDSYRFLVYIVGDRLQLQLFLLRLKKVFATMRSVTLYPRDKNIQSMSELGLDMNDIKEMCLQLIPADCARDYVTIISCHKEGMV